MTCCAVGAPRTSDYRPAQYDTVHPSPLSSFLTYLRPESTLYDHFSLIV